MRFRTARMILCAAAFALSASNAAALDLTASVTGVFTDSTFATLVPSYVDNGNGTASASLADGQFIMVEVDVANAPADLILGIFATLVTASDQVTLIGASPAASILAGGPVFMPTNLINIGSGAIKGNSPHLTAGTEQWIQALAYGAASGSDGTGPDLDAVTLFLAVVPGVTANEMILFTWELTAGDEIGPGTVTVTFDSTSINVPEPGAFALALTSLGTVGLVTRVRRRS